MMARQTSQVGGVNFIEIIIGLGGAGSYIAFNLYNKIPKTLPVGIIIYDEDLQAKPPEFPEDQYCCVVKERVDAQKFCEECYDTTLNPKLASEFSRYWPGIIRGLKNKCQKLGHFEGAGLGQSRPKGFLGFLYHIINFPNDNIINKVERLITMLSETHRIDVTKVVNIRIICSFAGGTGSSAFLDLAYLLRKKFPDYKIYGYFILAEAAMHKRERPVTNLDKRRTCANTYAAFWELKYWMKGDKIFRKRYKNDDEYYVEIKREPFDVVYLFDLQNTAGKNLPSYKDYQNLIVDCIYDKIARKEAAQSIRTWLGNNETPPEIPHFHSMGRAILLYPRKDILRLLGLYFLRDYIEQKVVQEDDNEIRKGIESDIRSLELESDKVKLSIKGYKIKNKGFPTTIGTLDVLIASIDKKNYENVIKQIKNTLDEDKGRVDGFLKDAIQSYIDNKKKEFVDKIKKYMEEKGISYVHGYIHNLLPEIEGRIKDVENLLSKQDSTTQKSLTDLENALIYISAKQGGGKKEKEDLKRKCESYLGNYCELKLLEKTLEFYKEFSEFLKKLMEGVNVLHDPLKKEILNEVREECIGYEMEIKTFYEEAASIVKVMPIKENLERYKEIYNNLTNNSKNIENDETLPAINDFKKIIYELFEEVLKLIEGGKSIGSDEKKEFSKILKEKIKGVFEKIFENKIYPTIYDALYEEARKKRKNYEEYLNDIFERVGEGAAPPFLRTSIQTGVGIASQNQYFTIGNKDLLEERLTTIIVESGISINIEEVKEKIGAHCSDEELKDKIIFLTFNFGYNPEYIDGFQENGIYYLKFKEILNSPDKLEVFIDARHTPP